MRSSFVCSPRSKNFTTRLQKGLPSARLGAAVGKMLESVGMVLIFLAVNLTTSVLIVLVVRGLADTFVSAYAVDDAVWLGLSLIQGLAFQSWRGSAAEPASGR